MCVCGVIGNDQHIEYHLSPLHILLDNPSANKYSQYVKRPPVNKPISAKWQYLHSEYLTEFMLSNTYYVQHYSQAKVTCQRVNYSSCSSFPQAML